MLLHALMPASRANGPGERIVVWFRGCNLGCDGCFNIETHAFGGPDLEPEVIARSIIDCGSNGDIEGVTFSGGEPMQQAPALLTIARELRHRSPQWSLGMFTGYTEPELNQGRFFCIPETIPAERIRLWHKIGEHLDFAIMGRYNRARPSTHTLCSSRNQILRLFSERYTRSDFGPPEVEVLITSDGVARVTGFPILGSPA